VGNPQAAQVGMLEKPESNRPPATFIGVLPGPRNGMTLLTQAIVGELRTRFDLREFDVGRGVSRAGAAWRLIKFYRSLLSTAWLLGTHRRSSSEWVYLVANSHGGLYYNLLQALAARLRGYPVLLHHHVYSYITAYDWRMALLLKLCGARCRHVVACPTMADDLDRRYATRGVYSCVAPSIAGATRQSAAVAERPTPPPLVIGHLSNLTREKGLLEVIETVRRLARNQHPVRCLIAGPAGSLASRRAIEAALLEFPDQLQWLGPVFGDEKAEFYRQLHAFVFPTRYRNESWGMVLDEALAAGVPVITYQAGCTPYLVHGAPCMPSEPGDQHDSPSGGVVLSPSESLPARAAEQIEQWIAQPEAYAHAAQQARRRGKALAEEGRRGLRELIDCLLREGAAQP